MYWEPTEKYPAPFTGTNESQLRVRYLLGLTTLLSKKLVGKGKIGQHRKTIVDKNLFSCFSSTTLMSFYVNNIN